MYVNQLEKVSAVFVCGVKLTFDKEQVAEITFASNLARNTALGMPVYRIGIGSECQSGSCIIVNYDHYLQPANITNAHHASTSLLHEVLNNTARRHHLHDHMSTADYLRFALSHHDFGSISVKAEL